jgi:hypothetical protein
MTVGLNVQVPWSTLLINGDKSVETRTYPLPKKYEGVELALIETPGKSGKFKARIIGAITFSHSFKYPDKNAWIDDYNRHLVKETDELLYWNDDKPKYGWVVCKTTKLDNFIPISNQKGIIFRRHCYI